MFTVREVIHTKSFARATLETSIRGVSAIKLANGNRIGEESVIAVRGAMWG